MQGKNPESTGKTESGIIQGKNPESTGKPEGNAENSIKGEGSNSAGTAEKLL